MKTEPKIGERVAWDGVRYRCYAADAAPCTICDLFTICDLAGKSICARVECRKSYRIDRRDVILIREGHYSRKQLSELMKKWRV